jgi:hypothetical protein
MDYWHSGVEDVWVGRARDDCQLSVISDLLQTKILYLRNQFTKQQYAHELQASEATAVSYCQQHNPKIKINLETRLASAIGKNYCPAPWTSNFSGISSLNPSHQRERVFRLVAKVSSFLVKQQSFS